MADTSATLSVTNLGGIKHTEITLTEGVNVLRGENATNRTSLLKALNAVLGGTEGTVRTSSDETEGRVELEVNGQTFTRVLKTENGAVTRSGDSYSNKPEIVDTFATLLEYNKIRTQIERGEVLQESAQASNRIDGDALIKLLMSPVDTDVIEGQIDELKRKRNQIENQISEIEQKKDKLPDIVEEQKTLKDKIEDAEVEVEELEEELSNIDYDVEDSEEAESVFQERDQKEAELENRKEQLERTKQSITELESEIEDAKSELEEAESEIEGVTNRGELDTQIEQLREEKREREADRDLIDSVFETNQRLLRNAERYHDILHPDNEDVTSQLAGDVKKCWVCGQSADRDTIESRMSELHDKKREIEKNIQEKDNQIDELQEKLNNFQERQRHFKDAQHRVDELKEQKEDREQQVQSLEDAIEQLEDEVAELNDRAEEVKDAHDSEVTEVQERLSDKKSTLKQLQNTLKNKEKQIEELDSDIEGEDELREDKKSLTTDLKELRGRVGEIQTQLVDELNKQLETVIELLQYRNIVGVKFEMKEKRNQDKRLYVRVSRERDSGAVYSDPIATLSESEREVIGLAVAVAGYLVHDVNEEVPFLLLDSLESIDSERINKLLTHLSDTAPFVVAALLEEDAESLTLDHTEIESDMLQPA